mgnify:CR=1 FL=1
MTTFLAVWAAVVTVACVGLVLALMASARIIGHESTRADLADAARVEVLEGRERMRDALRTEHEHGPGDDELRRLRADLIAVTEEKVALQHRLDEQVMRP